MTTDAVGGVWQYSIDLARHLEKAGVQVLLVCLGPEPSEQQLWQMGSIRLIAAPFALEWTDNPWESIEVARGWLTKLEREFRPDVLHLNSYSLAAARWKAPVVCVAHSCVYSWWRAVNGCAPGNEWKEYREQVSRGLRAAAAVVAPSRAMLSAVVSEYRVAPEKASVIPNFSTALRSGSYHKEPFALAAGRMWDKAKNLALLEALAPQLRWPLYVAGSGTRLGALTHDEILTKMAGASLFVHPALYEPFGLVVLEAARMGCCLVLADIPSLRELWEGAAIFVNPRDTRAWAKTLNRLSETEEEREEFANLALQAAKGYSADRSVRLYRDLYDRVSMGIAA